MVLLIERRTIVSTSSSTAQVDDIVLRVNDSTRLIFRPLIVKNDREREAAVKGTFVYQKKGKHDQWTDSDTQALSSLKTGEGYKLSLSSEELLSLYRELGALYEVHQREGVPRGQRRYVLETRELRVLANMSSDDRKALAEGSLSLGAGTLSRLIRWFVNAKGAALVEHLEPLKPDTLANLNAAIGIANLKQVLKVWAEEQTNSSEDFWHKLLEARTFVLEQIFSVPVVVIKSKAYVGGKVVANDGGRIVDFLVANRISTAAGLVEIKTPTALLLAKQPHRNGVYNVSDELSAAVMQALNYRHTLVREQDHTLRKLDVEAFDPRCVVLIGNAEAELVNDDQKRSFELFRRQLVNVEIVTYDELFARTERLVEVLEGREQVSHAHP